MQRPSVGCAKGRAHDDGLIIIFSARARQTRVQPAVAYQVSIYGRFFVSRGAGGRMARRMPPIQVRDSAGSIT